MELACSRFEHFIVTPELFQSDTKTRFCYQNTQSLWKRESSDISSMTRQPKSKTESQEKKEQSATPIMKEDRIKWKNFDSNMIVIGKIKKLL